MMSGASKLLCSAIADALTGEQFAVQCHTKWLRWLRKLRQGKNLCFR
jgi:hypothetical protein